MNYIFEYRLGLLILMPIMLSAIIIFVTLGYIVFKKDYKNIILKKVMLSKYFWTFYVFVITALIFLYY